MKMTNSSRRHKKKPWRYRWPDDFRDEVLARLLELNKQRAEQERLTGYRRRSEANRHEERCRDEVKKSKTEISENASLFDSLDAGGDR